MARKTFNDPELCMQATLADKVRFVAAGLIFCMALVLALV